MLVQSSLKFWRPRNLRISPYFLQFQMFEILWNSISSCLQVEIAWNFLKHHNLLWGHFESTKCAYVGTMVKETLGNECQNKTKLTHVYLVAMRWDDFHFSFSGRPFMGKSFSSRLVCIGYFDIKDTNGRHAAGKPVNVVLQLQLLFPTLSLLIIFCRCLNIWRSASQDYMTS